VFGFPALTPLSPALMLRFCCHAAPAQLLYELVRRYIERILLKDPTDNNHRMCTHDVDNDLPAKLGEIVRSYHGVFVTG